MPKATFDSCITTKAAKVPDRPEWIHEVKHDGYRLIVQRQDKRVRLFTRNGHDWSKRYPLIVEAALRNRHTSFVVDGEAVLLGVDAAATSTACTLAGTTMRCSSTPSICWFPTAPISAS
jgi:ATP-dependent DNA ligase